MKRPATIAARVAALAACAALAMPPPAHADDAEQIKALRDTTLKLINLLVEQGVLTRERADALIREALGPQAVPPSGAAAAGPAAGAPAANASPPAQAAGTPGGAASGTVRVPYVPQVVRDEIREEVKQEVLATAKSEGWAAPNVLPAWVNNLKVSGDVLLRFQQDRFSANNVDPATYTAITGDPISNTTQQDDRLRFQARLGVDTTFQGDFNAGLRVSTGDINNPVSTTETFGNYFNRYNTSFDRAYIRYTPNPWLTAIGGRFGNPFFGTDMVWSSQLAFDGIAVTATPQLGYSGDSAFLTAGAFPVKYVAPNPSTNAQSAWLYGYQAGLKLELPARTGVTMGVALYDYHNVEGKADQTVGSTEFDETAPTFIQKGNSLFFIDPNQTILGLASKFRELDVTALADYGRFDPFHVMLEGDYVRNIGFNRSEILSRTTLSDIAEHVVGYQFKLTIGRSAVVHKGDWQGWVAYRYLENDAVLDAFNDPDFHLGGTNAKGYMLGLQYAVSDNTWLRLRWFSSDQINGPPLSIDTVMLEADTRF